MLAVIIGVLIAIIGWRIFKVGIYTIILALNEVVKSVDKAAKK